MKPGTATYRDYYSAGSSPTATILYCVKESKGSLLRGQTDYSTRSPLAMGETPPSNDYPLDCAVEWILSNNVLFGGDEHVDLRVNRIAAMSSLCRTKPMKISNPTTGATTALQVADLSKPLRDGEAGLWLIEMAQYLHDTRVLSPSSVTSGMLHSDAYFYMDPTLNQCRIMNEDNFQIVLSYLQTMSVLQENSLLASWATVEESIRQLIQHDQLKSIYQVELCYAVVLSSETHDTTYETCPINAVYVLSPCWEIKGYAMNKANAANFIHSTSPDSETTVMNGFGWDFHTDSYTLCLNAETGLPMQDSDLVYEVQDATAANDS